VEIRALHTKVQACATAETRAHDAKGGEERVMAGAKVVGQEDVAGSLEEALAAAVERLSTSEVFTGPPAPEPPRSSELAKKPAILASALPASPIRRRPRLVSVELRAPIVPSAPAPPVVSVVDQPPVVAAVIRNAPPKPPPPRAVRGTPPVPVDARPRVVPPPPRRAQRPIPAVVIPSLAPPEPPLAAVATAPVEAPSENVSHAHLPDAEPRTSRHRGAIVLAVTALGAAVIGLFLLVDSDSTDGTNTPPQNAPSEPLPTPPPVVVAPAAAPSVAPEVVTVEPPARPVVPEVKRKVLRRPAKVTKPAVVVKPAVTSAPSQPAQPARPATPANDLDSPFPR
jgi:hypothetical protein